MKQVSFFSDRRDGPYSGKEREIEQMRRQAELLRMQSMQPLEGQMVSGHYIRPNVTQGMAQMLRSFGAGQMDNRAQERSRELEEQRELHMSQVAKALAPQRNQAPELLQDPNWQPQSMEERLAGLEGNPLATQTQMAIALSRAQQQEQGGFQTLSPEQAQQLGLPSDGVWQMSPTGEIKQTFMPDDPKLPTGMRMGEQGPEWIPGYIEGQMQQRQAGAPRTSVTVDTRETGPQFGTIPAGHMLTGSPDEGYQMMPVSGSPAEMEAEQAEQERRTQREAQATIAGFTLRDARMIDENIDQMADNAYVRSARAKILGTPEYEVNQDIESLRGTISIEQLLNIKRQGAGLGQVPQAQLDMLSRLMGELNIGRSKDRLRMLTNDIQERYLEILDSIPQEERDMIGISKREYGELKTLWGGAAGDIPEGVDPSDWEFMTEEERALFR